MTIQTNSEFNLSVFCPELDAFIAEGKDPTTDGPTIYIRDDRQRDKKSKAKGRQSTPYREFVETGVVTGPKGSRILNKEERKFVEDFVNRTLVTLGLYDPYSFPELYELDEPPLKPKKETKQVKIKIILTSDHGASEYVLTVGDAVLIETSLA